MISGLISAIVTMVCTAACVHRLRCVFLRPDYTAYLSAKRDSLSRDDLKVLSPDQLQEGDITLALADWELSLHRDLDVWAHVPRTCARVASSVGFLCAAMALRSVLDGWSGSTEDPHFARDALVATCIPILFGAAGVAIAVTTEGRVRAHVQAQRLAARSLVLRVLSREGDNARLDEIL